MKKRLFWMSVALLALTLLGQVATARLRGPTLMMHASWAFRPTSFAQAREQAQLIVLAEVVSVKRGEDLVLPAKGEPNDEDRIPTQQVQLKVLRGYRGAEAGMILTLAQTGGAVQPPAPKEGEKEPQTEVAQMVLEGDPLYRRGQRYLLLLEPNRRQQVMTISPEGRYRLTSTNTLTAMVRNKVTAEVNGKSLEEVERMLNQ